jgi:hypothetical protein
VEIEDCGQDSEIASRDEELSGVDLHENVFIIVLRRLIL